MEQVYSMEKPEELAGGRASPQSVCCQLETQGLAVAYIQRSLHNVSLNQQLQKKGVVAAKGRTTDACEQQLLLQNNWHVMDLSLETTEFTLDATSCS